MLFLRKCFLHTTLTLALITPPLVLAESQPPAPPAAAGTQSPLDGVPLQGKIIETMNSNGYTYLLLEGKQGKVWVAIPETTVKVGQEVNCAPGLTMNNFTSKTLNRTFEAIIFSPGLDKGEQTANSAEAKSGDAPKTAESGGFSAAVQAEQQGSAAQATATGASTGSAGAVVPSSDVNVNKASGANSYSVGECFEQGKALQGKTVRVRGKVMKISRMIMGKNWIHLQDGTGNPLKNQHDLVVTTADDPGENAIVTIEGTLNFERDFGAGYTYEVIVEDAKLEK